jgi:hypothetical protein
MNGARKLECVYAAGRVAGDDRAFCIVDADAPGMRFRLNSTQDIADFRSARRSFSVDCAVDT